MTTPMIGKHVTIKPKHRGKDFNPRALGLDRDTAYEVAHIQKWKGEKRRVFVKVPGRDDWVCVYSSNCKELPRCKVCQSEHHKTPRMDKHGNAPDCPGDVVS